MEPRPFAALTVDLETELRRLGYTDGSIRQYHQVWRHIGSFLEQKGSACFTFQPTGLKPSPSGEELSAVRQGQAQLT